jgi:multimeric flavodoxin WrbA
MEVGMKILAISCSPNPKGNTVTLLNEALDGARLEGAETELYSVSGKRIEVCRGCRQCWEKGTCIIDDDMQALCDKMAEADGIVLGTPIYSYTMTAQLTTLMQRTGPLNRPERNLANKIGGVVVSAGSLGLIGALKDIYFWYVTRQMLPANFVAAYSGPDGELAKMEKCMKAAKDLGRQMAKLAALKFEYPKDIERSRTAYGTHTR